MNRALLKAAAEESSHQIDLAESATVGAATLEQMYADVVELARHYALTPPWQVFTMALKLRQRVQALLTRTRRPDQQRDLYLLHGQLCGLLAVLSFDLGDEHAASQHARAAWGFGEHIGHSSLRAWARGTQALIAYWSGRPDTAVRLAQSGRRYLTGGTGLVRLCCIEARAWSHLGNRTAVRQAIAAAHHARERAAGTDELHDEIGGEFGFGPARQARCEGTVYIQLGNVRRGDPQIALARTRRALELYAASKQVSLKVIPQAHADLAAAHLLLGSISEAEAELAKILELPVSHRIRGLIERLALVRTILAAGPLQRSHKTGSLRAVINDFISQPASPAIMPRLMRAALPGSTR